MDSEGVPGLEVTIVANDIGPVGGMERQLSQLISGLLTAGHRVRVISWTCELPPHPNLRWIRVPGPSRPFALAYPLFFLLGSLLVLLRGRGVVHSTGAIVLNRTAVCTVHFCHRAVATLPSFSRASKGGLPYRLNARIARSMSRLAERWCYRPGRTQRLVAVSEGVAGELRDHFPSMADRVQVIPNGVDTETFRPRPEDGNGYRERIDAIFVGSEWERKGLRVAIEALGESPEAALTVVGEGDVEAFRGLAERLGVGERVKFAGATSDVAPWYRRADVFLLPTSYEAAPLVTYEAAASGLPLLVTRVNGVEDLIRDGVNGWFVARDAGDVAARLRRLASDSELREKMGVAARQDSLEYSWSRVVERYIELYREITSATNSAT
jgi:glycosyltransferase involved in cell wall biosynthesis